MSLLVPMRMQILRVTDAEMTVNYGVNKVRFLSPGVGRVADSDGRHFVGRHRRHRWPADHRQLLHRSHRRVQIGLRRRTAISFLPATTPTEISSTPLTRVVAVRQPRLVTQ